MLCDKRADAQDVVNVVINDTLTANLQPCLFEAEKESEASFRIYQRLFPIFLLIHAGSLRMGDMGAI